MQERLQKIIAASGLMSRRAAEELIAAGKVKVNGRPVFQREKFVTIMLNKPAGVVTTLHDEQGRPTVASLVSGIRERIYPVGRLDMYSEGLLLLTNDGELANAMMHPAMEIPKTYMLVIKGEGLDAAIHSLSRPIEIDGRLTTPAEVKTVRLTDQEAELVVTIHEGRNRQIRRLCERAGVGVVTLRRIKEGPLALGNLKKGCWRELTEEEMRQLRHALHLGGTA